ncbi:hypothetical protein HK099_000808 [Clydaea vesicula]|uniref:Polysaccharide lyase 14 domain-containing protein n=1 Tax=Clydaea vesicula TaxID=447962 RepID=A0AAD5U404_9FUNG|nr:hypothetical protein HK099_000808 [Clydaea vesicula]
MNSAIKCWEQLDFNHCENNKSKLNSSWGLMKDTYGQQNRTVDHDPDPCFKHCKVLKLLYPKGSANPGKKEEGLIRGGMGAYCKPVNLRNAKYCIKGLFGSISDDKPPKASGGAASLESFSTRLMFRENGGGEIYLYVNKDAQHPDFCDKITHYNSTYGYSIGRNSFYFQPGKWCKVRQEVTLNNTEGDNFNCDGSIKLYFDDKLGMEKITRLLLTNTRTSKDFD